MGIEYIEYKVFPTAYEYVALKACCLYFSCDDDYFIDDYEYEIDDDYNYRMGLLCYLLKQAMFSDFSISVFLKYKSVADVRYFLDGFSQLIKDDSSVQSDFNSISRIADQLNVKTVKVPVIYIPNVDDSTYDK